MKENLNLWHNVASGGKGLCLVLQGKHSWWQNVRKPWHFREVLTSSDSSSTMTPFEVSSAEMPGSEVFSMSVCSEEASAKIKFMT